MRPCNASKSISLVWRIEWKREAIRRHTREYCVQSDSLREDRGHGIIHSENSEKESKKKAGLVIETVVQFCYLRVGRSERQSTRLTMLISHDSEWVYHDWDGALGPGQKSMLILAFWIDIGY
jgi:hypothetical protein